MVRAHHRRPLTAALTAAALALAGGCASLPEEEPDPVQLRLTDLESRLIEIEQLVENESLLELAGRVDELRQTTRELTGEIEELRFELEQAQERQQQQYLDLDGRLAELEEGGGASGGFSSAGGASGPGGPPDGVRVPDLLPVPDGDDQANYDAAFRMLSEGRYEEAAEAFEAFLLFFPDSPLAANAQYWQAEAAYVQRDFERALDGFSRVIESYSSSDKVPDALLKMGYSHYELERWDAARDALELVSNEYQDTTAAELAVQRLERMRSEGR